MSERGLLLWMGVAWLCSGPHTHGRGPGIYTWPLALVVAAARPTVAPWPLARTGAPWPQR